MKIHQIKKFVKNLPRKNFFIYKKTTKFVSGISFLKFILIFLILLFSFINISTTNAQSNSIQVDLGVTGCNHNGLCEKNEESSLSCPADCPEISPSGYIPKNIPENHIYDISIFPEFTSATISWKSTLGSKSLIKWGQTTEVKEGTLASVTFEVDHKVEIINLKPGTMYYFVIESQDIKQRINIYPPVYFFTKFLKDTTFPLSPTNVKISADISGITISWQNPKDENFSYVRIMRYEDRFRSNPFWGKLIYEGTAEKFLDKDVVPGKKYYYVLFSRDINGNFSGSVAISKTAFSPKKTGTSTSTPTGEIPKEISLTETFFAYQYNQSVEALTNTKIIILDDAKSTIVDTKSKTFPDDLLEITNDKGEIVGQYLFSFNEDSGRYQAVIPPLQKAGNYNIKIYRYKDNILTIISEGSFLVEQKIAPKIETSYQKILNIFYKNYMYILILLLTLLLLLVYSHKRRKS